MCVCLNRSCVRSFAGCADLNLAGRTVEEGLVSQVQWRSKDDSLANQWSAEFTRHVLVTVRLAWNLDRSGPKKSIRYQVQYPVENPPKVNRTVLCRTMQWKSATSPSLYDYSVPIFWCYFQQDNAPCHKAQIISDWFLEHDNEFTCTSKVYLIKWPVSVYI